jgi:phage tail sheath protein FI
MSVTPTYPGVYIQEIPSGVRTITGIATSITAFVGWAKQGPTAQAQLILSWSDFQRQFGGLDANSLLSYAVYQFFNNGGSQAYIVRLTQQTGGNPAKTASHTITNFLTFTAANAGGWGNNLQLDVRVNGNRFAIIVRYLGTQVESFMNLSLDKNDPNFVLSVVGSGSQYIQATLEATPAVPGTDQLAQSLAGGADGDVLSPGTGDFHTALNAGGSGTGVHLLDTVSLFNLLVVPGETDPATIQTLESYCRKERAFLIADVSSAVTLATLEASGPGSTITGDDSINAAFYFPWVQAADPLQQNRTGLFPPSGFVAGIYARTDASRGVWKAPAGSDASLTGAVGLSVVLTDDQNGVLNPQAVNCIRSFPVYGIVLWGARTLRGNDQVGSEWKYIPVRRLALYIEGSLYRGTQWVVFEPNDEPLWAQIRLNVGAFMQDLFRKGAFQGQTPRDAYFVKCDSETTTQSDINLGIVNILVGFAPLKPAEFVVIQIQQMAGQLQS